jgi:hypothetical protein
MTDGSRVLSRESANPCEPRGFGHTWTNAPPLPAVGHGFRTHRLPPASSVCGTCTKEGITSSTAFPQSRAPGGGVAISIRRFVNEEIARVVSSLDDLEEGHQFEFLCECGDPSCNQLARMTVAQYRALAPGYVVGHPVLAR